MLESSRVLAVRGHDPARDVANVTLCADTREPDLTRVAGESQITDRGKPIERVYLEPEHVPAYPGVVRAILEADLIIAGPGSLYTSVLPNLLVEEIQQALATRTRPRYTSATSRPSRARRMAFRCKTILTRLVQHSRRGDLYARHREQQL